MRIHIPNLGILWEGGLAQEHLSKHTFATINQKHQRVNALGGTWIERTMEWLATTRRKRFNGKQLIATPFLVARAGSRDGSGWDTPMDHATLHFEQARKEMVEVGHIFGTPQPLGNDWRGWPQIAQHVGIVGIFAPHAGCRERTVIYRECSKCVKT